MIRRTNRRRMQRFGAAALLISIAPGLWARDKKKQVTLPGYILQARTVAVIIDPDAGRSLADPDANRTAQRDVEAAIANWKRFELTSDRDADLIIEVHRGTGKAAAITVRDPGQNNRPGSIQPIEGGIILGGQSVPARKTETVPQAEVGSGEDTFVVFQGPGNLGGSVEDALDAPAGWRLVQKDALKPHTVPAVEQFRRAIAEAEKAAAQP